MSNLPLLSLLIWLPIIGGILVLLTGDDRLASRARGIALLTSLVSLALCVPLVQHFNLNTWHMQFQEFKPWINLPDLRIDYALGVDGISMPLIVLTVFATFIVILASWRSIQTQVSKYMAAFLISQGVTIGMFAALNALLFYVYWEAVLIPMYLIIGIWGSSNRNYASIKFFLYTFLGSALMLIALLYLGNKAGSYDLTRMSGLHLPLMVQVWIFLAFILAFGVKVPMWPVHTWLPDAHTEAPAGGSVILAAIMLKMGGYGFLRFILPMVPKACLYLVWPMVIVALIAIVYIGFVALAQKDMKRLIAYSSISHMGFVTLASFMCFLLLQANHKGAAIMGLEGGMMQMISHAFSAGALFLGVGVLYDRLHTRLIKDYSGVANVMPVFASLYMVFILANVGLPGTSGFVGEFMVILSAFQVSFWVAFVAATTLVLGAAYTLWMYKRVYFGAVTNPNVEALQDIDGLDKFVFSLLAICVIGFGVYPNLLLNYFHATVAHLVKVIV